LTSVACILLAALAQESPAVQKTLEQGRADRGGWELVWRYDEASGVRSAFRAEAERGRLFPFTWREHHDTRGHRIEFYDGEGLPARVVALHDDERGCASENGLAWIVRSPDSADSRSERIRYFREGASTAVWDVLVTGDLVLVSPDGEAVVLATAFEGRDPYFRALDTDRGRLRILGGEAGEVRGELPILPMFSRATGDGSKLAFLHDGELFLVGTNGRLVWKRDVPVDRLVPRSGLSPLATGGDLIAVYGTGVSPRATSRASPLHPDRAEFLVVFDLGGNVVWDLEKEERDTLRFNPSCALSPDGSVLATLLETEKEVFVAVYDAYTGEKKFDARTRRCSGTRTLTVAPGGETIALVFGDLRSTIAAWDSDGRLVFEGQTPYRCQSGTIHEGRLVAAEHWVLRLVE
jgi:hypothetical protein